MASANQTDNKIYGESGSLVIGAKGKADFSDNRSVIKENSPENYTYNYFPDAAKESLTAALGLVGTISTGILESNAHLTDLSKNVTAGLQAIASDTKQAETPNYTKYVPYAVIAIVAIVAVLLFKR